MTFEDEVKSGVDGVLAASWDIRDGIVVPTTDTVKLSNGAVKLDATYVYADMADSSTLAQTADREVTGKVIRAYLNAATRILKHYGGEVRSFDGDRVMAIFVGGSKNNEAVRASLAVNWAVSEVLKPKLEAKWPRTLANWSISHGIGIDTGTALMVRGGVREHNDLVSIGDAPNVAAKLSEIRTSHHLWISRAVYHVLKDGQLTSNKNSQNRWTDQGSRIIGGRSKRVYSTGWWWSP